MAIKAAAAAAVAARAEYSSSRRWHSQRNVGEFSGITALLYAPLNPPI